MKRQRGITGFFHTGMPPWRQLERIEELKASGIPPPVVQELTSQQYFDLDMPPPRPSSPSSWRTARETLLDKAMAQTAWGLTVIATGTGT